MSKAQVVTFTGNTVCMTELDFDTFMNSLQEQQDTIQRLCDALGEAADMMEGVITWESTAMKYRVLIKEIND